MMYQRLLLLSIFEFANAVWFIQDKSNVLDWTWSHLKEVVRKTDDLFLVQIYEHRNEKCQKFAKEYEKIAEGLKGFARVAAVDTNQVLEDLSISTLPAFGIFSVNRSEITIHKGKVTSRRLVHAVFEAAENMAERELSRSLQLVNPVALDIRNYDQEVLGTKELWFVAFIGHNSDEMGTVWDEVSRVLKIEANFGYVDTVIFRKYAIKYGIEGISAILYIPRGVKALERVIKYKGSVTFEEVLTWVKQMIEKPPNVEQITNKSIFLKTCSYHENCGILFIPEIVICGVKCRKSFLDMLKTFSHNFLRYTYSWLWCEAVSQRFLEKSFKINHIYPTLIILDFTLMNYTALRGFSTEDEASEFVENVAKGNGKAPPYEMVETMKFSHISNIDLWEE